MMLLIGFHLYSPFFPPPFFDLPNRFHPLPTMLFHSIIPREMECTNSSTGHPHPNLPPGFRFHPTDEELVVHYLKRKASSSPLPVEIIADVDLYKFDPWELPAKAAFGEHEWYFFSPRDRKYPKGARPNRAATSGYWKATGTDKPVLESVSNKKVGVKKGLVFYGGKPPKGIKTNWIMHEYRLDEEKANKPHACRWINNDFSYKSKSVRLDDWVLCRIYKKNKAQWPIDSEGDDPIDEMIRNNMSTILPSIRVSQLGQQNLSMLLPNNGMLEEKDQSLLEGVNCIASSSDSILPEFPGIPIITDMSNSFLLKRNFMPPLWPCDEDEAGPSSGKRLRMDNSDESGSISIGSQFESFPVHEQMTDEELLGDEIFQLPYQVLGMNWYS